MRLWVKECGHVWEPEGERTWVLAGSSGGMLPAAPGLQHQHQDWNWETIPAALSH